MASSSKENAFWSPEDVETFCKLCVEQIDNGNRPANNKRDGWTVIIKKFEDLRGKKYDKGQMKSKWDNLKEDWKRWRTLVHKETGLGWDPRKNTIDASDEWWEMKIQENPKVRPFRMKGIHPDLQALLDRMFGDTVATGSITWNPAQGLHIDEDVVATQFDIGGSAGAGFSDDNIEDDIGGKSSDQHRSDKRTSQSSVRQSQGKKQKKSTADKLASQMERICSAIESRSYAKEVDPYKELMETLKAIPEIKQNQELYFFALDYFSERKDNRQIFMNLDDDQEKVTWLKYKFAQRRAH